jgi:hypothetical protein
MIFKSLFAKKSDSSDFDKLITGMTFLSIKMQEFFDEDDYENFNILELGIFMGAFNSACYLLIKETPKKSDLTKFGQHTVDIVTNQFVNAPKSIVSQKYINKSSNEKEIQKLRDAISEVYSERVPEYCQLILNETKKDRGSCAFVGLTCGVLNRLFEDKKPDEERYDPGFAAILANHLHVFGKAFTEK